MGLSRLAASTAPSAAPAPTIVWSSSMKRMTSPRASAISLRTAFRRSSKSPRYFEPASSAPMSSAITRRSRSDSGTSPSTIRWARPSTMAVLPTPGSPIRTGLFFVRRERTWMTRRISSSRPITGSRRPAAAASVRSLPNLASASYLSSGLSSVTRCGPRTLAIASATAPFVAPALRSASPAGELWPARESRRCSVEMYSSCISRISCSAARRTAIRSGSVVGSATDERVGCLARAALTSPRTVSGEAPIRLRMRGTSESSCSSRMASRCCGVAWACLRLAASEAAASMAARDFWVKRSSRMGREFGKILVGLTKIVARSGGGLAAAHHARGHGSAGELGALVRHARAREGGGAEQRPQVAPDRLLGHHEGVRDLAVARRCGGRAGQPGAAQRLQHAALRDGELRHRDLHRRLGLRGVARGRALEEDVRTAGADHGAVLKQPRAADVLVVDRGPVARARVLDDPHAVDPLHHRVQARDLGTPGERHAAAVGAPEGEPLAVEHDEPLAPLVVAQLQERRARSAQAPARGQLRWGPCVRAEAVHGPNGTVAPVRTPGGTVRTHPVYEPWDATRTSGPALRP